MLSTSEPNITLLIDLYEITMANGYLENGKEREIAYFDMFFRTLPDSGGFAIMAGLEQLIEYIENLHFTEQDIRYLRGLERFSEPFLEYLESFRFTGDIWAVPEGTPIFPYEPIVTVRAPLMEAQFIETMLLLTINHQSLIATKANRIVRAAGGRSVVEFGSRRAQGYDAAVYGARAAFIGGCTGTACVLAGQKMGIPVSGTMAHSWIQTFDSELEAFRRYARLYPDDCTLLVDTYSVLSSGIPNAIRAFNEELVPRGYRPKGVRIDSGDITYLSKKARKMLDEAGFPDCKIVASNSLDENIIRDILIQGAKVDIFGVGERLITAASTPVFDGVYKLAALERDGKVIPKIKLSENIAKITTPGHKCVWRLFDRESGKAIADVISLAGEQIDDSKPFELFDPDHTWKRKIVENFVARKLQKPVFQHGMCVYRKPKLNEIADYCTRQVRTLWEEVLRFENPHRYYVDLSDALWRERQRLLDIYMVKKERSE